MIKYGLLIGLIAHSALFAMDHVRADLKDLPYQALLERVAANEQQKKEFNRKYPNDAWRNNAELEQERHIILGEESALRSAVALSGKVPKGSTQPYQYRYCSLPARPQEETNDDDAKKTDDRPHSLDKYLRHRPGLVQPERAVEIPQSDNNFEKYLSLFAAVQRELYEFHKRHPDNTWRDNAELVKERDAL